MMFPESFLTKIFERPDVCMIPMQYQSAMIQAIGEVLDEHELICVYAIPTETCWHLRLVIRRLPRRPS